MHRFASFHFIGETEWDVKMVRDLAHGVAVMCLPHFIVNSQLGMYLIIQGVRYYVQCGLKVSQQACYL